MDKTLGYGPKDVSSSLTIPAIFTNSNPNPSNSNSNCGNWLVSYTFVS